MNTKELIVAISASTGQPKKVVNDIVAAFVDVTKKSVNGGESVRLTGFGTFKKVLRKPCTQKDLKGNDVKVGEIAMFKFAASRKIKDFVNEKGIKKATKAVKKVKKAVKK